MTLSALLSILGLYGLTLLMPGPAKLFIIGVSVSAGRARGLYAASGVTLASLTWSSIAAFGFAAAMRAGPEALHLLRWIGALYLVWLSTICFRAFYAGRADGVIAELVPKTDQRAFAAGFLVHLANPNAAFFWLGLFAFAVDPGFGGADLVITVALCGFVAFVGFSAYAAIFSKWRGKPGSTRARRLVALVLGTLFAVATLRVVWQLMA